MIGTFQLLARNGLARRTFIVLAATVTVIVLGVVGLVSVWSSRYLHEEIQREASAQAKQYGLGVFQRLELAALALDSARSSKPASIPLAPYFDHIEFVEDSALTDRVRDRVQLRLSIGSDERVAIELLRKTAGRVVVARIDPTFLWQPDAIPSHLAIEVKSAAGESLFVRSADAISAHANADSSALAVSWSLFLRERFGADEWRVDLGSTSGERGDSLEGFRLALMLSLVPLLAGMAWLASVLIRRSHAPLERLIAATQTLSAGRFDAHVDEIGDADSRSLIRAFNEMTNRIGHQWRVSQLWSSIDESILRSADVTSIVTAAVREARRVLRCDTLTVLLFEPGSRHGKLTTQDARGDVRTVDVEVPPLPGALGRCAIEVNAAEPEWTAWISLLRAEPTQLLHLTLIAEGAVVRGVIMSSRTATAVVDSDSLIDQQHLSDRFAVALAKLDRDEALIHAANVDDLTQLANRRHLQSFLAGEIDRSREANTSFAFMFLDLDRFKLVNDAIGHGVGDAVLQSVAAKLRETLPADHFIARLGGDEFTVIVPGVHDREALTRKAEAVLAGIAQPMAVGDHSHVVSASIGIAVYPRDGTDVVTLMRNADISMYQAKRSATTRYAFYDARMSTDAMERVVLEADLRSALANQELVVHYQPQVDMRTGQVIGAEALLRWNHPRLGMLTPDRFLPIAEDVGLIVPIGEWVTNEACRQFREWLAEGIELASIAVNASIAQLMSPQFTAMTEAAMSAHHLPRGALELEITETAIARDIDSLGKVLAELRELGATIAIDDFGVGYSSLTYLQRLPFDTLKIDRSFMPAADPQSGSLCLIILEMAKTLRKQVVAEGVETAEQAKFLRESGCSVAQGYYFARPLTADAFCNFVGARVRVRDIG